MKKTIFILGLSLVFLGCKESEKTAENDMVAANFESFGDEISAAEANDKDKIAEIYSGLKSGDTLETSFSTRVKSVCKKKGCWMILDVPGEEVRVTFKDYGFFMPKDIEDREVVVSGKAFIEEMSVEDQRHYAEDAGKSEEEIAAITKPSFSRSFIAEGVLLKK